MNVLLSLRNFSNLLQHKKFSIVLQIAKIENRLMEVDLFLHQLLNEHESINQQLKLLISCGVLKRSDIYQNIRLKGVLLSRQQLILHQVNMLEDEKITQEKRLHEQNAAKGFMEKKLNKVSRFLSRSYRDSRIRCENNNETELQEIYCHVREKF